MKQAATRPPKQSRVATTPSPRTKNIAASNSSDSCHRINEQTARALVGIDFDEVAFANTKKNILYFSTSGIIDDDSTISKEELTNLIAATQLKKEEVRVELEATLLPLPEHTLRWHNGADADDDKEKNKATLEWLQKGLVNAHLSSNIKNEVKHLLAVDRFTSNMDYMDIFDPLQTFCKERLLEIGAPLQQMYQQDKTIQDLANLSPVLHPELANHPTISHLRQDHPIVGLISPFDHSNFNDCR